MNERFWKTYSTVRKADPVQPSGLFTWDIHIDRMYGDPSVAEYFGLDADEVGKGLPVESFLARIHADDRADVAHTIHDAIITGDPHYQSFRTRPADGGSRRIHAIGQCFRDHENVAKLYAGIAFDPTKAHFASLSQLCTDALSLASNQGQDEAARLLQQALRALQTRH